MNTITERAAKNWTRALDLPAPTRFQNQFLRSLEIEPEFKGSNRWSCASQTRNGVIYEQEVFFTGIDESKMLNLGLHVECGCPSVKPCKHQLAVERKYHASWEFYFHLFGLPTTARMGELHSRAVAVAARMENERYYEAA